MPATSSPHGVSPTRTSLSSSSASSARASPIQWSRRANTPSSRLSDPRPRPRPRTRSSRSRSYRTPSPSSLFHRVWQTCLDRAHWLLQSYLSLTPLRRILTLLACTALLLLMILTLIYSHRFFAWLAPMAKSWRQLPGGWLIVFTLIFVTAFPPIIGYSTANTIAGLVYGFPWGWPIAAAACVLGSLCAFLASRTILSGRVERMVGGDHRFVALGQVLRKEGILYLTGIRFCPLPFSLSNGFLATVPSISAGGFALSTALSTRLAILAEQGDKMSARDKAINYMGMALGGTIGLVVGLAIYRRTMARAEELVREEGPDPEDEADAAERAQAGYDDVDGTAALLDPEDAAAVMSDDDVSLWEGPGGHGEVEWRAYNDGEERG
ncbi:hypothetical protein E4U56_007948 [Claviceps arundinis]|uniref:Golgi apparatus membrane protein TVP38 n=2 Tax=Claviceps arundinis TaxID=1623583 RepID=A0A9P7SRG2_9HYPO|nr:hypothetical protein E4U56_007948 [Claviceps arundinis]